MKGTIKAYSQCVNAGVINGADGKTYRFSHSQWDADQMPQKGESVTFEKHHAQALRVKTEA